MAGSPAEENYLTLVTSKIVATENSPPPNHPYYFNSTKSVADGTRHQEDSVL
jgi:hypothetical protein